jgi:hypothetical protein
MLSRSVYCIKSFSDNLCKFLYKWPMLDTNAVFDSKTVRLVIITASKSLT